jgi:hypothetical protein
MDEKDTNIDNPDGLVLEGDTIGHADKQSRIRKRDGVVLPGEEMGYVDAQGKVRRPNGIIFRGEEVGQVKGNKAYDKDGLIFAGEEWGYVDAEGNICQKDGFIFKGRIIGKMKGTNKSAALGFFVLRFREIEDRYKNLEQSVRAADNKTPFLSKVQHMLNWVPEANALGDFDSLINRLKDLEKEIVNQFEDNRRKKEELVQKAESLSRSTDWKVTAEELKKLQDRWKEIRSAGKDHEERLWQRFRSAMDAFFQRRSEFFEKERRRREENLQRKEQLCSRAQSLINSSDTRSATEQIKRLQAEWKSIGPVPREQSETLWERFRGACDQVFEIARKEWERKAAEWEKRNRERMSNLRSKEHLCTEAESLTHASDMKAAIARVKELQEEWKSIGPVPKEQSEGVWQRFRQACDRVFQRANEEWERKQTEWKQKLRDTLEYKREKANSLQDSIEHDEGNIERWQDTINNLHEGGRADEIRDSLEGKISDVESRIASKKERLEELEEFIRDIERKLYE